ncbi:GNAT family N-acetyltransferase [Luteimonas mephitis]|uniref:GNAT family N-acetyltransferase n=1 Tax=Luteimonas mephitis TaxID=83615 RepID=UPI003A941C40
MSAPLQYAPLESSRFGLRVARGTLEQVDERALARDILAQRLDVAIVRLPANQAGAIQRLSRSGLHAVHADTLVYYEAQLQRLEPAALRNADLAFSPAQEGDEAALEELIEHTFADYQSHYHANPRFPSESILAGYRQWARGYVGANDGRQTWVARREGRIVAFACCRSETDGLTCEGVLYGVHPDHAGGGLYGDLIRHTQAAFRSRGFQRMKVSTQIQNFAVQKVWAREGFTLIQAFDTFHINALLSCGELAVDRELQFSNEDVVRFANASGDRNAVHLEDAAARAAGFEQRISHGMLAGAELSRIFGMEFPGAGTLYLRAEMVFLQPVYPGRNYRLQVRFPDGIPASGYAPAVATIEATDGSLCLISYHDLLKRN